MSECSVREAKRVCSDESDGHDARAQSYALYRMLLSSRHAHSDVVAVGTANSHLCRPCNDTDPFVTSGILLVLVLRGHVRGHTDRLYKSGHVVYVRRSRKEVERYQTRMNQ